MGKKKSGKKDDGKATNEEARKAREKRLRLEWESRVAKKKEEEKQEEERLLEEARIREEEAARIREEEAARIREEEAARIREEEAARIREEEAARLWKEKVSKSIEENKVRLTEKDGKKSQFGGVTYLVIEFPKGEGGGHQFRSYLGSSCIIPPCMVKGIYVKRDTYTIDPPIDVSKSDFTIMKEIYKGERNVCFIPIDDYNTILLQFLKEFMANMYQRMPYANTNNRENNEWHIAYYWRLQWLKHGRPHGIGELDFYWKIYDLYMKIPMHGFLMKWWRSKWYYSRGYPIDANQRPTEMTDQITVMVCTNKGISRRISSATGKWPVIYIDYGSHALRQILIGFDVDEKAINAGPGLLSPGLYFNKTVEVYI